MRGCEGIQEEKDEDYFIPHVLQYSSAYPFIGAHAYTRTYSLTSKCSREIKIQFLVKMNTVFKLYTKFYFP